MRFLIIFITYLSSITLTTAQPESRQDSLSVALQIDQLLQTCHQQGQFNGVALVVEKGRIMYHKAFGLANVEWQVPNTPDAKFQIGSISKQFTAMLATQLAERQQLDLRKPISTYLPKLIDKPAGTVTAHQLLTHTSGLPPDGPIWRNANNLGVPFVNDTLLNQVAALSLQREPGAAFAYSNLGYVLLGVLLENVSGKTYEELLDSQIVKPLGLKNTGVTHLRDLIPNLTKGYEVMLDGELLPVPGINLRAVAPAGGLYSTAADLYTWERALYTDKLLTEPFRKLYFTPEKKEYAYGWFVMERPMPDSSLVRYHQHTGRIAGVWGAIQRYPDHNRTIIILNNTDVVAPIDDLRRIIGRILFRQPYELPPVELSREVATMMTKRGFDAGLQRFRDALNAPKPNARLEANINECGYWLLSKKQYANALALFTLNTTAYPKSANAWDSYAEGLLAAGNRPKAIESYEKVLILDPHNEHVRDVLTALRQSALPKN